MSDMQVSQLGYKNGQYTITTDSGKTRPVNPENIFGEQKTLCIKDNYQPVLRDKAKMGSKTESEGGIFKGPKETIDCTQEGIAGYFESGKTAELASIKPGTTVWGIAKAISPNGNKSETVYNINETNSFTGKDIGNLEPGKQVILPKPEPNKKSIFANLF